MKRRADRAGIEDAAGRRRKISGRTIRGRHFPETARRIVHLTPTTSA